MKRKVRNRCQNVKRRQKSKIYRFFQILFKFSNFVPSQNLLEQHLETRIQTDSMEVDKDNTPRTPKRERRVKTSSLTLGDRGSGFFGTPTDVPSSVYATPSRRVRQASVTCGSGEFFGDFPSLNETPEMKEEPGKLPKFASGDIDVKDAMEPVDEKKEVSEQSPKQTSPQSPQKKAGSFFSSFLHKKSDPKCVN